MKTTVRSWTAAALLAMASLVACESESTGGSAATTDAASDSTASGDSAAGSDTAAAGDATAGTDVAAGTDAVAATDAAAQSDAGAGTDASQESDAAAGTDATASTDTSGGCGPAVWADVDDLFASSCGGCHSGAFKYDANSCESVSAKASLIIKKIEDGSMPKGATLGAVAKGKMLLWLNSGASCAACN